MDPVAVVSRFGEQGILFFGMALVVLYLIIENRSLKKDLANAQAKYEALMEKVITLTTNCATQLESFNKTINTMTETLRTWREDFIKGKRE